MRSRVITGAIADLEASLVLCRSNLTVINGRINSRQERIANLNQEQTADLEQRRVLTSSYTILQNRIFARTVLFVPTLRRVRFARKVYLSLLLRAGKEDITVATKRKLEGSLELALPAMQSICPHPFVFSYDGYSGSSSRDWDDARNGYRVCAVCNFHETSMETNADEYVKLAQSETRLVRRDLRREKDRQRQNKGEWFSLDFLQNLFEHSAGTNYLNWSDVPDLKLALIAQ